LGVKIRKWLIDFMSSGPIVKIALEGPQAIMVVRKLVGKTVPFLAEPGTIRGDFSIDNPLLANLERRPIKNLIHASGNKQEAENELKLWFKKEELIK
jgi:nucleoside-diphosphate kinase